MAHYSTPVLSPVRMTIASKFSIDLNSLVVDHFLFLKNLHESNVTQNVSLKSFEQYQWYWLPSNSLISPDVAWLWHCHRLAPSKYRAYMEKTFPSKNWEILPSSNPYRLNDSRNSSSAKDKTSAESQEHVDAAKLDEFALLSSAKRQAELYWHLQPYFTDGVPNFDTELALNEYYQFLMLMKEYPKQTLVPTYLIDLYWHTHMTGGSVEDYATDCRNICGRFIDHDDEYGDGDRDGVLGESFEATAKLWQQVYGDSTYKSKGGYRGPPPPDYYPKMEPVDAENDAYIDSKALATKAIKLCTRVSAFFTFKNCFGFVLTVFFVIGLTSFLLSSRITTVEYACEGAAPSQAELDFRKAIDPSTPVCLTTSNRDEVLCLQAGANDNRLARYCHTNLAEEQAGYRDWYLWWSPCTKCGTAWRMNPVVDDDKSFFKHPAEAPAELPLGRLPWQRWDPSRAAWLDGTISIEECDSDADGIPSSCYVEKRVKGLKTVGLVFLILTPALLLLVGCYVLCKELSKESGNSTGTNPWRFFLRNELTFSTGRTSNNQWNGGGGGGCGGGGGGGGCGGGGGGCGGC